MMSIRMVSALALVGGLVLAAGWAQDRVPAGAEDYAKALAAGRKAEALQSEKACLEFRRALELATTDAEKADALLGLGRAGLVDLARTDYAATRAVFEQVLALGERTPAQRVEALLGVTETFLAEMQYPAARQACAQAREAAKEPGAAARVQLAWARTFFQERRYPAARRELTRLLEQPDLERDLKYEAESLRDAIDLQARVRADHPRVFLNDDTWPAVRERALGAERELFDDMKARLARIDLKDAGMGNWSSPDRGTKQVGVMEAAFVYRMTGDPAALDKVRGMLRASMEADWGLSYSASTYIMWATALDWVWNDLPPPERQALADAILRFAYGYVCDVKDPHRKSRGRLDSWPHYYTGSLLAYAGLGVLDPAFDDVSYARALALVGMGCHQYRDRFANLIKRSGDDGVWQTNIEYDLNTVPTAVWSFLYAWQPAFGAPLPAAWSVVGISPHVALRMMVDLVKGYYRHMNYAGHSNGAWGFGEMNSEFLYDNLGHFVNLFARADPEQAAMAQYFRRWMVEAGAGPGDGPYPVFRFLMTDLEKAPPPELPAGLPVARYFENVGLVLMSSGFGPGRTYALFSQGGGPDLNSRHDWDVSHFSIYKAGFLALDTGVRFALPHSPNYRHMTVAHNAVLIHMPGERFPHSATGPVESNAGGQNRYPQHAKPLAFETHRLYAYTAVDAAPVYHTNKCAQMTRQFVYLPPDHFVVFDRVTSRQTDYPKTWLLHTANEPRFAGKEFRAEQGEGRIYCRTLLPADAVLEPVGGPGKEFWADGRNWAITDCMQEPGAGTWWKRYGRENTEPPEAMGRWRVEVKPGAAREEDYFLHLIQVGGRNLDAMSESQTRESADRVELSFRANGRDCALAFNKTGAVGGHIRLAEDGAVQVGRALTETIQAQVGLALEL